MKLVVVWLGLMLLSACSSNDWQVRSIPNEAAIAAALDDQLDNVAVADFDLLGYPKARMPQAVRPCCAFGTGHKVKVGPTTIPFYRFANTVALDDIGPHAFEAGNFSHQKGLPDGSRGGENNGMIYTQQGGFIDLAHVRDTADNTVALFYLIQRQLGESFQVTLPDEIGPRHIQFQAVDTSAMSATERRELAIHLAARQAYFMAEAHEIAQWHGYRTLAPWSEEVSAYSPEDLYSNMLGAKIAIALLSNNLTMNTELYNQHMTQWLAASLAYLQPVDKAVTNELFAVIDGHWWDSSQPLPSKDLLIKRHYQLGDKQSPYLVPSTLISAATDGESLMQSIDSGSPAKTLSLLREYNGIALDEIAVQHLSVAPKYQPSFNHIPAHLWQQGFTHADFSDIARLDEIADLEQAQKVEQ